MYARRGERGLDSRYAYWTSANLYVYQTRERVLIEALRAAGLLPLTGRPVLDAGCGDGGVLRDLLRLGATFADLSGVDLLEERVERARAALPGARIDVADAQALPYEDGSFDLVLAFTLLSSVLDDGVRRRIAAELRRVLRPGGAIVVYDFWVNPLNRDARPLKRDDLRSLFPDASIDFRSATLAPPVVRVLTRLPGGRLACALLEVLPFVHTHYIATIRFPTATN